MIAIANWQYVRFSNGDDDNTDDESVKAVFRGDANVFAECLTEAKWPKRL